MLRAPSTVARCLMKSKGYACAQTVTIKGEYIRSSQYESQRRYGGSSSKSNGSESSFIGSLAAVAAGAGIFFYLFQNRRIPVAHCATDNWTYKRPKVEKNVVVEEKKSEDAPAPVATSAVASSEGPAEEAQVLPALPAHVPYLIVGAGTAAMAAYRAIRAQQPNAKVLLIGEEEFKPYMRPPLSKDFWFTEKQELLDEYRFETWSGRPRSIFFEKDSYYCEPGQLANNDRGGVAVATGKSVVRLNSSKRFVTLDDGTDISYDKCLIATGGRPRSLAALEKAGSGIMAKCTLFRSIEDYKKLSQVANEVKSIAVIGGGFLGSELAVALAKRGEKSGVKITQLFPESGNMGRVLPEYLSEWTTDKVRAANVNVKPSANVTDAAIGEGGQVELILSDGDRVSADHVVIAVGLQPNTELAGEAGLELDEKLGGFMVNAELEAASNVWVAGDAACFYDVALGRRRVEHHDHAVVSGRLAGENMTGAAKRFTHQSMFWSDLGPEIGYEAIGLVDSSLQTVAVFAKSSKADTPKAAEEKTGESLRSETEQNAPTDADQKTTGPDYGKGVIFYTKGKKVVGVLCWNVFNKIGIARKIIKDGAEHDDLTEVAKLFDLYPSPAAAQENTQSAS